METLKPQFVPGQAMGPSMTSSLMEEKLTLLQLSQENDNLKAQVNIINNLKSFSDFKLIYINSYRFETSPKE